MAKLEIKTTDVLSIFGGIQLFTFLLLGEKWLLIENIWKETRPEDLEHLNEKMQRVNYDLFKFFDLISLEYKVEFANWVFENYDNSLVTPKIIEKQLCILKGVEFVEEEKEGLLGFNKLETSETL